MVDTSVQADVRSQCSALLAIIVGGGQGQEADHCGWGHWSGHICDM